MATATGLGVFYFLIQWIVVIVKCLILKGKRSANGVITSVSDKGSECEYVVSISDKTYILKEKKKKDDIPSYNENTNVECIFKTETDVIFSKDYAELRKGLYMMPIYSIVCAIITVVLIYIASGI